MAISDTVQIAPVARRTGLFIRENVGQMKILGDIGCSVCGRPIRDGPRYAVRIVDVQPHGLGVSVLAYYYTCLGCHESLIPREAAR